MHRSKILLIRPFGPHINSVCVYAQVQGQPLMVQVSGGQLITSTGQPIMVQAMSGAQGQTIMQMPVSGAQGLQQVREPPIRYIIV